MWTRSSHCKTNLGGLRYWFLLIWVLRVDNNKFESRDSAAYFLERHADVFVELLWDYGSASQDWEHERTAATLMESCTNPVRRMTVRRERNVSLFSSHKITNRKCHQTNSQKSNRAIQSRKDNELYSEPRGPNFKDDLEAVCIEFSTFQDRSAKGWRSRSCDSRTHAATSNSSNMERRQGTLYRALLH